MVHSPVLVNEVLKYLDPRPGENFIDGTCGSAGHLLEILKQNGPGGRVLCLDLDPAAIERVQKKIKRERFEDRAILVNDNFSNIERAVKENNFFPVSGILLDLGMSSEQLEKSNRGFSFQKDEALDMRFSPKNKLTACEIVNQWPPIEIEKILKQYGEERFAKKISSKITSARQQGKILTTQELVGIIGLAIPEKYKHGRTNFATRTFQALRIAVNDELGNLEKFLPKAFDILRMRGRIVIISFHSLEDRIIKKFFREEARKGNLKILTKKPVVSAPGEVLANPRSRSAKLRAAIKIT